ncbi:MAG: winged helix-turn-helix transcriptional regulator [Deltaproteobacteria bacterium]|nr:winged helix-turn-helix transcriptional regulator [Deltaproteobacteria bacterium]
MPVKKLAPVPSWTFLSNHAHVLLCLAQNADVRIRDVANRVGITERTVQSIMADLTKEEIVAPTRIGRRNRYEVDGSLHLRHPLEAHRTVRDLMRLLRTK